MPTVTIQIGNTDNKLTQQEWSSFIAHVTVALCACSADIRFRGGSAADAPWQNYAWVANLPNESDLRSSLSSLASRFRQDNIAYTVGATEFIA